MLVLYFVVLALFNVPALRQGMAHELADRLSEHVGSEVRISDLHIGFLNRVVLDGVEILDRQGRVMLDAKRMAAKIDISALLNDRVNINSVSLLDANVVCYRQTPEAEPNFKYFLDAFASKDTLNAKPLDLRIGSVILRRCNVSYDEYFHDETPQRFNPHHLAIKDLDANISLRRLTDTSIDVRVRSLSFREKSGLDIRSMTTSVIADASSATVDGFDLQLPNSRIQLPHTLFYYNRVGDESLFNALRFTTELDGAQLSTADIAPLLPEVQVLNRQFGISAVVNKTPSHIRLNHLRLNEADGGLRTDADLQLTFSDVGLKNLQATLRDFQASRNFYSPIFSHFSRTSLPAPLAQLGDVSLRGQLNVDFPIRSLESAVGKFMGDVRTSVGNVDADLSMTSGRIAGNISADNLQLARLLSDSSLPSGATFKLRGTGENINSIARSVVRGELNIASVEYKGRTFRDVVVNGELREGRIRSHVLSHDPALNIDADVSALADARGLHDIYVEGDVQNFRPSIFGMKDELAAHAYSGHVSLALAEIPKGALPSGSLMLRNFFVQGSTLNFGIDSLVINSEQSERGHALRLESDLASLSIDGSADIVGLKDAVLNMLSRSLPDFFPAEPKSSDASWYVDATLRDPSIIADLTGKNLALVSPLKLHGNIFADGRRSTLYAETEGFTYSDFTLREATLLFSAEGNQFSALLNGKKDELALSLSASADDGRLGLNVDWDGFATFPMRGSLHTLTSCSRVTGEPAYHMDILPSSVAVGDTLWEVSAGTLAYADKALDIRGVSLQHLDQGIMLDGRFSDNPTDSIVATLQKMDVEYILGLVRFDAVHFAGQASGRVSLSQRFGAPDVKADLTIPAFLFNGGPMGDLHLVGGFNADAKRILLDGHMKENADGSSTICRGYVSLGEQTLDLDVQSDRTNLQCLRGYLSGIVNDFGGTATGHLRIFGPLKKIDFEGEERLTGNALLPYTGVRYSISDGLAHISPGEFAFDNVMISDNIKGTGVLSGFLHHNHLKHFTYAFDATASELLVYDKEKEPDLPFYATAYGSGNIIFSGRPGSFDAEISMRPDRGTTFTYIVDTPEGAGDARMISFRDPTKLTSDLSDTLSSRISRAADNAATDIHLNMLFDVNPDAQLRIVMNEKSGDVLALHGGGQLRASYYNKGNFRLYGTYRISEGNYRMNIQDILRKDFRFVDGGTITFGGDPFEGDLDMQGIYTVNSASLSDLGIGSAFSQSSVRVNCLLNFSGKAGDPKVTFDLDLPTVNAEEKQMLLGVISTEEEMTTQVLYLLGVGRFYTNSGIQANTELTAGAQSSAAMKSFLSTTLSSQLNQIISDAVGSTNWTFGANVSTGSVGTNDVEATGLLSGRLFNNRLLVNGNIGYRDNTYYNTNFIGDFDVQYLLTPGGSVRLKAYSETNDRYFTKSALTTQGVGVQLSRDFTNLRDLFSRKKQNNSTPKK